MVTNDRSDRNDEIIYINSEIVPNNVRNDRIIETEFNTIITRSKSANINKDRGRNRNTRTNNSNNKSTRKRVIFLYIFLSFFFSLVKINFSVKQ